MADVVPFLLHTRLEPSGAKHTGAVKFQPWVVADGHLVTGQNPASAAVSRSGSLISVVARLH